MNAEDLEFLLDLIRIPSVTVGAVFASDEEAAPTGGTPSPQMLLERGYVPRKAILVGDTTGDSPRTLFTAEKGHAVFTLVAHGRGGHSSVPWTLDNPIPKLIEGYSRFAAAYPVKLDSTEPWQTFVSPTKLEGAASVNAVPDTATMSLSCRYAHLALPTVIYGAVSHGAHAEDEWVSLSDLGAWPEVLTEYLKCR